MGIKDMAAKAKEKLGGDTSAADRKIEETGDRFDEATGDRFSEQTDRAQETANQRLDEYMGDDPSGRNRGPGM